MSPHVDAQVAWVLDSLGQQWGLGGLALDDQRRCVLDLQPGGLMLLLQDLDQGFDEGFLVAVSAPCDWPSGALARRLLMQADFRRHRAQPVRWIWNSGRVWASVRLSRAALKGTDLESAIERLCGEMDGLAALV